MYFTALVPMELVSASFSVSVVSGCPGFAGGQLQRNYNFTVFTTPNTNIQSEVVDGAADT